MIGDVPENNDKPEDGDGAGGGVPWTIAEIRVMLAQLEGRVMTSEAKTETVFERVEASIAKFGKDAADRETRNVKWMAALVVGATAVLAAFMAFLTLFPRGG